MEFRSNSEQPQCGFSWLDPLMRFHMQADKMQALHSELPTGAKSLEMENAPVLPAPAVSAPANRTAMLKRQAEAFKARGQRHMLPLEPLFMHGTMYDGPLERATVLWSSSSKPRKDYAAADWLTATEYQDAAGVAQCKAKQLATLMRLSKRTVVYSGAGISASVVGQAALSGQNKVGWTGVKTEAHPTPTHWALGALGRTGWIHGWVQQNHE